MKNILYNPQKLKEVNKKIEKILEIEKKDNSLFIRIIKKFAFFK